MRMHCSCSIFQNMSYQTDNHRQPRYERHTRRHSLHVFCVFKLEAPRCWITSPPDNAQSNPTPSSTFPAVIHLRTSKPIRRSQRDNLSYSNQSELLPTTLTFNTVAVLTRRMRKRGEKEQDSISTEPSWQARPRWPSASSPACAGS